MSATIIRGDARHLPLPDASVDLIVTSPPYFGLRSYQDGRQHYGGQIGAEATPREYVAALLECTAEWMRILKPTGSIFVNIGDAYYSGKGAFHGIDPKNPARRFGVRPLDRSGLGLPRKSLVGTPWRYALAAVDDLGLTLRAEIIWSKLNPTPDPAADRAPRTHEHLFHLTKSPRYYADPSARPARSVWEYSSQPLRIPAHLGLRHDAVMPLALARDVILGWSPAGGIALDPFGGSGTVALAADVLGRRGISIDRSADYCRLAAWRTTDPGERARALGVPKPPPVMGGQGDLFEEAS